MCLMPRALATEALDDRNPIIHALETPPARQCSPPY